MKDGMRGYHPSMEEGELHPPIGGEGLLLSHEEWGMDPYIRKIG